MKKTFAYKYFHSKMYTKIKINLQSFAASNYPKCHIKYFFNTHYSYFCYICANNL